MFLRRLLSFVVLISFLATSIITPSRSFAADAVLGLPQPGTMVNLSPAYAPLLIKGLKVHPENPLLFDFIIDTGSDKQQQEQLKTESEKLIKYFLATLAIPEKDLWVNLSPYEKDRMITKELGQTELGRDMLAQDYVLKQLTASLIYPEKRLGKDFWDRVYAKAQQMYGTSEIPVNTFNKVWILADKANVYVHNNTAFVVGSHLKVMLEEDYLALKKNTVIASEAKQSHTISSQIIKEIILPEIEKEVNQGQNFSSLRQIFHSMILATWFKQNLKTALLNQVYSDKVKVGGLVIPAKAGIHAMDPEYIYQQYLKAYKKGVFNYIKEEPSGETTIPRKYFSGGLMDLAMAHQVDETNSDVQAIKTGQSPVATGTMFSVQARMKNATDKPSSAAMTSVIDALGEQYSDRVRAYRTMVGSAIASGIDISKMESLVTARNAFIGAMMQAKMSPEDALKKFEEFLGKAGLNDHQLSRDVIKSERGSYDESVFKIRLHHQIQFEGDAVVLNGKRYLKSQMVEAIHSIRVALSSAILGLPVLDFIITDALQMELLNLLNQINGLHIKKHSPNGVEIFGGRVVMIWENREKNAYRRDQVTALLKELEGFIQEGSSTAIVSPVNDKNATASAAMAVFNKEETKALTDGIIINEKGQIAFERAPETYFESRDVINVLHNIFDNADKKTPASEDLKTLLVTENIQEATIASSLLLPKFESELTVNKGSDGHDTYGIKKENSWAFLQKLAVIHRHIVKTSEKNNFWNKVKDIKFTPLPLEIGQKIGEDMFARAGNEVAAITLDLKHAIILNGHPIDSGVDISAHVSQGGIFFIPYHRNSREMGGHSLGAYYLSSDPNVAKKVIEAIEESEGLKFDYADFEQQFTDFIRKTAASLAMIAMSPGLKIKQLGKVDPKPIKKVTRYSPVFYELVGYERGFAIQVFGNSKKEGLAKVATVVLNIYPTAKEAKKHALENEALFELITRFKEIEDFSKGGFNDEKIKEIIQFLARERDFIYTDPVSKEHLKETKGILRGLNASSGVGDEAMTAGAQDRAINGGIDLNSRNMAMSVDGEKVDIRFDPAMIAQFKAGDFSGVVPVILNITPISNILPLLGLAPGREEEEEKLAKT